MAVRKIQLWRPDTHPGHSIEIEWEFDPQTGRDTGREHRAISIRFPDGRLMHRDTNGQDEVDKHYQALISEHAIKNRADAMIIGCLPDEMKKPLLDSDGDPVLDDAGEPRRVVKDKHRPAFRHLGGGFYEFLVAGLDDDRRAELARLLEKEFSGRVKLLNHKR